ncbi:WSC domain-containing protein [Fusarium flagelliforme]|uniref:WSC domain-containing protein n=1 Tax=Fusarium flagelliforme TaxID=2675880 RepID=UPI001E8DDA4A|nr:WSC domain-containing protein [Fusarium flagelliforme]KAH7197377.1 WSC domain-containing protein [Fusarium flagelliforme]
MRASYITTLLLSTVSYVSSQDSTKNSEPSIYRGSNEYTYYGCYNETTQVQDSAEERALADGSHLVKAGKMTVPMCLDFCTSNGTQYKYAGLEWSRECWCSPYLSSLSAKLDDDDCENPCEGNSSQVCGGPLRLSVYQLSNGGDAQNKATTFQIPGVMFVSVILGVSLLSL